MYTSSNSLITHYLSTLFYTHEFVNHLFIMNKILFTQAYPSAVGVDNIEQMVSFPFIEDEGY